MADVKISALPAAAALDGTEVAPVVQSGATKKALLSQVLAYVQGALALAASQITSGTLAVARGGTGAGSVSAAQTALGIIPATIPFRIQASNGTWTNMPAALTEWNTAPQQRTKCDLTNATQARIVVRMGATGGVAGAELRCQYSTDESTWNYLDGATGPSVAINVTNAVAAGAWVALAAGAKADVFLRVIGINGDGVVSPQFGNFSMQVK